MFLSRALGAALLAVPLAGASGQSASLHPPPDATDDSATSHRFAWIASGGVASAAVFTTFVRLSGHDGAGAQSGPAIPGTPVPNRYTNAALPGDGLVPGQDPPPTNDPTSQEPGVVLDGDQPPGLTDTPLPPHPLLDLPPLPQGPQTSLASAVTTPEPETLSLLGTGLIPLVSLVRRRRSLARRPG